MFRLKRVAFVSPLSNGYVHRLYRGALSHADGRNHSVVRDFLITRDFGVTTAAGGMIGRLCDWNPDGILAFLENDELERLLRILPRPCPVVCMSAVTLRPGVAVVAGSFAALVKTVLQHFRQQGVRNLAMLSLESEVEMEIPLTQIFLDLAKPADPGRATFVKVVDPALLDDPYAPVTPVPPGLARWLRELPKPCGVFCPETGGGGYLIRVCQALGLKVPQEVAVIGGDDADLSLASRPSLTSVMPMGEKIGFEAMKVLEGMMAGGPGPSDRIRLDAMDLHVRQSTGVLRAQVCDIAAALDYIQQQACHGLSVARLLQDTQQVSSKTFHTHFKAATGQTPGEAILARQMEEARRMLSQTELSITLVAEKSGFGSSSDFSRRFRLMTGKSPSDYRREARQSAR